MTYDPLTPPDRYPDRTLPEPEQIVIAPPAESTRPIPETSHDDVLRNLEPNSPREKRTVAAFKEIIASHLANMEGKTTEQVVEDLALAIWKMTRISRG